MGNETPYSWDFYTHCFWNPTGPAAQVSGCFMFSFLMLDQPFAQKSAEYPSEASISIPWINAPQPLSLFHSGRQQGEDSGFFSGTNEWACGFSINDSRYQEAEVGKNQHSDREERGQIPPSCVMWQLLSLKCLRKRPRPQRVLSNLDSFPLPMAEVFFAFWVRCQSHFPYTFAMKMNENFWRQWEEAVASGW